MAGGSAVRIHHAELTALDESWTMGNPPAGRTAARRPQKHLLDLDNPRPPRRDPMNLDRVQRWVLSTLAVSTGLHMAAGLVAAAAYVDESRLDARIGLLFLAGLFGVASVVGGLAIHRRKLVSPWLLLGTLPTIVGAVIVL